MSKKVYSLDGEIFGGIDLDDVVGEYGYYSGDSLPIKPSELVCSYCVDEILERMDERLYEECGDAADDSIKLDDKDKQELEAIIKDFMDRKCIVSNYKVVNIEFHELPPEDCVHFN